MNVKGRLCGWDLGRGLRVLGLPPLYPPGGCAETGLATKWPCEFGIPLPTYPLCLGKA